MIRFKTKEERRGRRAARVRAKVVGTALQPRLSVFRSNKHISAQLINDEVGKTLVSASDKEIKLPGKKEKGTQTKVLASLEVGKLLAEKAGSKKIGKAVFDRAGYRFTGRVKAVALGAREGGLQF
ncbi:MAG TPA: 50S ribosomal protein L18 [Candidatus Paceibacterota bacterium]|nr:50S ribosomal protein L18 [Candidatus Paceibacterota bacterium]